MSDLGPLKAAQDALANVAGTSLNCLVALAVFVLADPLLASVFITFLQTLQAQIALQKTQLAVLVAQANVTLAILNTEAQVFLAATSIADGLSNRFPLDKLMGCPVIASAVNAVQGGINSNPFGSIPGLGNVHVPDLIQDAKNALRKIRTEQAWVQQKITQMSQAIGQLDLFNSQIQALIDFFNAIKNFPGTLPHLPL